MAVKCLWYPESTQSNCSMKHPMVVGLALHTGPTAIKTSQGLSEACRDKQDMNTTGGPMHVFSRYA